MAGAFAAILLTGTNNRSLEIAGFNFELPFDVIPWQIYDIFLLDAFTYVLVIAIISIIKYVPINHEKVDVGSLFERLKIGFTYLKDNPVIFLFGITLYVICFYIS